ncbi:hypothetical protein ACTXT7_000464 [Hymenolepis weldensis]
MQHKDPISFQDAQGTNFIKKSFSTPKSKDNFSVVVKAFREQLGNCGTVIYRQDSIPYPSYDSSYLQLLKPPNSTKLLR